MDPPPLPLETKVLSAFTLAFWHMKMNSSVSLRLITTLTKILDIFMWLPKSSLRKLFLEIL